MTIYRNFVVGLTALLFLLVTVSSALAQEDGGEFVWIESWRHETSREIFQSSVSWTPETSVPILGTVSENRVMLYVLENEGPKFIASIEDLPEMPLSVHVTAVDQEMSDVWIGTESPGIVYVFRISLNSGHVQQRDRIRFAWDDIVEVIPFDLDDWGELDFLIRTRRGNLALFRWTETGYVEVPLGSAGRDVSSVAIRRGQEGGGQDIVIARARDHVLVLRWQLTDEAHRRRQQEEELRQFMQIWAEREIEETPGVMVTPQPTGDGGSGFVMQVWENYVWGNHTRLFVGEFQGNGHEQIAIFSSQGLIYVYEWNATATTFTPVGSPLTWRDPRLPLIGVGNVARQDSVQLIETTTDGIAAWRVTPTPDRIRTLSTSSLPIDAVFVGPDDTMIVTGPTGFSYFKARPDSYLRLLQKGMDVQLEQPAIRHNGTLYLSDIDWHNVTGVRIHWNPHSGRITGVKGFRFFVGHDQKSYWSFDGRSVELNHVPIVQDDTLYLPISFGRALGADITWEPYSYTLIIER